MKKYSKERHTIVRVLEGGNTSKTKIQSFSIIYKN